jgi:5-methylcytosine-specific restriction endonuclease McrA
MIYKKTKRNHIKETLLKAFGEKCIICGYSKSKRALAFHHVNPKEKEFQISLCLISWKDAVLEAKKCALLCKNCHGEVHAGILILPEKYYTFDEKYLNFNIYIDFQKSDNKSISESRICQ